MSRTATAAGSKSTDVKTLLGARADELLKYKARGVQKDALHVPGPDFVDRVLASSDRPPRVLGNFQRIIDREIPADIVFEDDDCLAFRDINPQAPVHVLIIPKREIVSLADIEEADAPLMGHLFVVARRVAEQLGLEDGFRTVINTDHKEYRYEDPF